MRIAICDDDPIWRKQAQTILTEYNYTTGMNFALHTYGSGKELLAETEKIDILFLDIEMDGQDGISTAAEVNKKWKNCSIVYLTDYISYATDVYETKHKYYVLKNQFQERVSGVFEKIYHEKMQQNRKLPFQLIDGRVIQIAPKDILYFERDRRVTKIILDSRKKEPVVYVVKDKISTIEEMLPSPDFVRCHNSYIVYFPAIKEVTKNAIVMKNEDVIAVSRQYQRKMREMFLAWARTQ